MIKCGLLGEKLGHSFSPQIHAELGVYEYSLYEKDRNDIEDFIRNGSWDGLNVTIPYKKAVIPFITELSPTALRTGSVNTILRRSDGSIFGDNTDVYGFKRLTEHSNLTVEGRKVLVLGSGGASAAAVAALEELNARPVVISRSGENTYSDLDRHRDAKLIVNATPVGMYPDNGISPIDLSAFPSLEGVLDLIYNPARTALLMQAEALGIPYENGSYMLVAQAKRSAEIFTGHPIPDSEIDRIYGILRRSMLNIVLTGTPYTKVRDTAHALGRITGRRVVDVHEEIIKHFGDAPEMVKALRGDKGYRDPVHSMLADVGKLSGAVITAESDIFDDEDDHRLLRQNGVVVLITSKNGLKSEDNIVYSRGYAEMIVETADDAEQTAKQIAEAVNEGE